MVRFGSKPLLLMVLAGSSSCLLYTDSINMPPQVDIKIEQQLPLVRGTDVTFVAVPSDPDEDASRLRVSWRRGESCSKARVSDEAATAGSYTFKPDKLGEQCVVARVTDSKGAFAEAERTFSVKNQDPKVVLDVTSPAEAISYPLSSEIELSAAQTIDPDPGETNQLTYVWTVTSPTGQSSDLAKTCPSKWCSFVATQSGSYKVKVVVTDPNGATAFVEKEISIDDDTSPCILGFSPATLHPQLSADQNHDFIVTQVNDDVDPYPPRSSTSSSLGTFQWLFRTSLTGDWKPVLADWNTSNSVTIARIASAGDTIQVRVTYSDRITRDFSKCWQADRCELRSRCASGLTWTVTLQ